MNPTRPDPVEIAQRGYAALQRADLCALESLLDPDIIWRLAAGLPYGGEYRGRGAVLRGVFGALAAYWIEISTHPERFIGASDEVVVLGRYRGRGRATGARVDVPFAHVWRVRDGRAIAFEQFTDTATICDAIVPTTASGRSP